jgi:hypothetical protein
MLHPHTELRFVSPEIGYGIFATKVIPKGTITWVKDGLDRAFKPEEVALLEEPHLSNLYKYTYIDKNGDYFFCWDLTRYVNHSFSPNSMLTTYDFEVAIVDIQIGDEITNDYGTFNILEPFKCAKGPYGDRDSVRPDDLLHFHKEWDQQIASAMKHLPGLNQPLLSYLTADQVRILGELKAGTRTLDSVVQNYFPLPV